MAENDSTLQPPDWLNKEFLTKVLRKHKKFESSDIQRCDIKPAVGFAENYSSCLFRVTITSRQDEIVKETKVIVKTLPIVDLVRENVTNSNFFEKETTMLAKVLPDVHKVLKSSGIKDKLGPEVFYVQGRPESLLVMEDLCVEDFRVSDRVNGLNLMECKTVMKALAQLHAGSVIVVRNNPDITDQFKHCFWEKFDENMPKMFDYSMDCLIKGAAAWFDGRFVAKLEKLKPVIQGMVNTAAVRNDSQLNVLTHGDMWTNNMMFKYSEDQIEAVKFVDFQLSCYNSPTLDLLYFLFTSPRNDVRITYFDEIVETYHEEFTKAAHLLNLEVDYTLQTLKRDLSDRLMFGFGMAITVLPLTSAPKEDALNQEEIDPVYGVQDAPMFRAPRYLEAIKDILLFFESKGLL